MIFLNFDAELKTGAVNYDEFEIEMVSGESAA